MKSINFRILFFYIFFLLVFSTCKKKKSEPPLPPCSIQFADSSSIHPKGQAYQSILNEYVAKGLPGIVLLINDANGTWVGSAGKADLGNKIDMLPCHVSKVGSITKLFIATVIMKLQEGGVLNIDDPITTWLPSNITNNINNANACTLRQLLNHQSGIYDVISDSQFYLAVLNNPDKTWTSDELLNYVYNKPATGAVGVTKYSNTNTLLASIIIEKVTGKPHATVLKEKIIQPLNLQNTYYAHHDALPSYTAQGYFDLYNNGQIQNLTRFNTGNGNGFTGLYTTVYDMKIFIEALFKSKTILTQPSLDQMLIFDPTMESGRLLGVGTMKDFVLRSNTTEYAWGHRGRDLAYSGDLYYFPGKDITLSLMVNYGTNAASSLEQTFINCRDVIVDKAME
jgi:D-alanyl-D-alanine carboxypeptidase